MSRRSQARVVAAVAVAWWSIGFFGLVDLAVPLLRTPGFEDAYVLETGWGLLYAVLVCVPFLALVVRPEAWTPVVQVAAVAVALAAPAVVTPALGQLGAAAALLGSVAAVRLRACGPALPRGHAPARDDIGAQALLVLALVAAVPAIRYARDMIEAARTQRPPVDITNGLDHWPTQAALGVAVIAVTVVAAGRPDGRRIATWSAGVTAAWLGAVSTIWPDHAGSLGSGLGVAAVVWGVAVAGVGQFLRRPVTASAPADGDRGSPR